MVGQKEEIVARDKGAGGYDLRYIQSKGILFDKVENDATIRALNLKRSDVVLDVGCGTGRQTIKIAKRCKKVYAVDFSPKSIEVLDRKLEEQGIENVETSIGDLTQPLPIEEKVDKIISVQVIQHIPSESARLQTLKIYTSQLKSGGICVVSVYNYNSPVFRGTPKEGKFPSGIYYNRFTASELRQMFEKCHFSSISLGAYINFMWYASLNKSQLYRLFYPIAMLDTFISRFKLSCYLGTYLVVTGIK